MNAVGVRLPTQILLLAIGALLLSTAAGFLLSLHLMERQLEPEIHLNAQIIAQTTRTLTAKVTGYGVPFDELRGMDDYLATVLSDNPDLSYLAVTDAAGGVRYRAGKLGPEVEAYFRHSAHPGNEPTGIVAVAEHYDSRTALPSAGGEPGSIHVGQSRARFREKQQEILYDMLTATFVSVLVALEILMFLANYSIAVPLRALKESFSRIAGRDVSTGIAIYFRDEIGNLALLLNQRLQRINGQYHRLAATVGRWGQPGQAGHRAGRLLDGLTRGFRFSPPGDMPIQRSADVSYIRPALFLLIFSESLSLSFFPIFVEELYRPLPGVPRELVIGLPISLFMLVWALSMPGAGAWSDRIGRRRSFVTGALITALGLALTAMAQTVYDLLIWRSITAVGYGIVFITCQGYIIDNTTLETRTRGMALFLSGFFSGALCGSAIGGILADRIGFQATFLLSSGMSLVAAFFVLRHIRDTPAAPKASLSFATFLSLLRNRRFMMVTLLSAIPAKLCLTGFLYYTGPLYLKSLGANQSTIGRVIMAYGICIIFLSPLVGGIVDRMGRPRAFAAAGGLLASTGLFTLHFHPSTLGVLISILLIGAAHAIGVPPQVTIASQAVQQSAAGVGPSTAVAVYRLIERTGNILGPVIAGGLIALFGFSGAFVGLGIITLSGSLLFIAVFFAFDRWDSRPRAEESR